MELKLGHNAAARQAWAAVGLVAFALAYVGLARLGLLFSLSTSLASPVWPPTGLAIAGAALWGRRVLPAVFAGAAVAEALASHSWPVALLLAAGNTAEAAVGGLLVRRAGNARAFQTLPGVLLFGVAAVVAPLVASLGGATVLVSFGLVPASAAGSVWWTWYLGDAAGAFVVAPVVLLGLSGPAEPWSRTRSAEMLALSSALLLLLVLVFGLVPGGYPGLPLLFLLMPVVVWSALRQGPTVSSLLVMVLDVVAVAVTHQGRGPFALVDPDAAFLILQAFVFTIGFMTLALAALASERRRAAALLESRIADRTRDLQVLNDRLRRESEVRRLAQDQLAEAQKLVGIGTWRWDISKPNAEWTPELYRIYGLDPATHVPTYADYLTRLHPDDVERVKAATDAVFRDHRAYSHDERIRRPDGSWRNLHTWAQAVLDDDGKLVALIGACQDTTERAEQERALQESLERFRALADASPIGIVHTRSDGIVDYVNERWRQITGVADHRDREAMRRSVHPDDQPKMAALWHSCVKEGREFSADMRFVHGDGVVRWTRARAVPVRDAADTITGFVSALADITNQRAAEAQEREVTRLREQAEFKTNFLRTAAHELGTPLTPIQIQTHILSSLLASSPRPEERKAIEILERNINRLRVLVGDMLESARLQSGRLRLDPRPIDLAHVVHDVVETFQGPAIQAGMRLDTRGPHELPVVADPDRLSQVLYNLISNAMKFTPAGGHISVAVANEGDSVRVSVTDSGEGFTPEQAARLFTPFTQLHDAMQHRHGGSGLGLYISRGIVEQHGGRIQCSSPGPGQGATFWFTVPRVAVPAPVPTVADATAHAGVATAPANQQRDLR